jgi:hypothetical protein
MKDIAQYLRKAVPSLQRWKHEMGGFLVRGPQDVGFELWQYSNVSR